MVSRFTSLQLSLDNLVQVEEQTRDLLDIFVSCLSQYLLPDFVALLEVGCALVELSALQVKLAELLEHLRDRQRLKADAVSLDLKGLRKGGYRATRDAQPLVEDAHVQEAVGTGGVRLASQLLGPNEKRLDEAGQTLLELLLLEIVEADEEVAVAGLEGVGPVELLDPPHVPDVGLLALDLVSDRVVEGGDGGEGREHPLEVYEGGRGGVAGSVPQRALLGLGVR